MGCVSSKHSRKELREELLLASNGDSSRHHIVSLTSSTYGVLKLDKEQPKAEYGAAASAALEAEQSPSHDPPAVPPEIINAWELMKDLEESMPVSKKSPKSGRLILGFPDFESRRSPLKFLSRTSSPKKLKRLAGKENKQQCCNRLDYSPKKPLKPCNIPGNQHRSSPKMQIDAQSGSSGFSGPLLDPVLVERDMPEEKARIKKLVSPSPGKTTRKAGNGNLKNFEPAILGKYEKNCPPGGEDAVVIYTTSLRGIRKTFEDCNSVRFALESHCVRVIERDVSMDSGFKEELRRLTTATSRVPLVFVKGRLIGGAEEMLRLEEEGKLGILLDGVPAAVPGGACEGCAGVRFVMCSACSGSCRVRDEEHNRPVRCSECNENGLIHCPICC